MDKIIASYNSEPFGDDLRLCPEQGIAYQVDMEKSVEYAENYFQKYIGYEGTEIANKLNDFRTSLAEKRCNCLLDIGIGSGEFIKKSKASVYGFDINEFGVKWLQERGLYIDPYDYLPWWVEGLTFWDSLEHIPNPGDLLDKMFQLQYAFISIPIFDDLTTLKESKHYRPNEHYYYYTAKGLTHYMSDKGFRLVSEHDDEVKAGREGILTFVFRKL